MGNNCRVIGNADIELNYLELISLKRLKDAAFDKTRWSQKHLLNLLLYLDYQTKKGFYCQLYCEPKHGEC